MNLKNVVIVGGISLLAIFLLAVISPRAMAFLLTGGKAGKTEA